MESEIEESDNEENSNTQKFEKKRLKPVMVTEIEKLPISRTNCRPAISSTSKSKLLVITRLYQ